MIVFQGIHLELEIGQNGLMTRLTLPSQAVVQGVQKATMEVVPGAPIDLRETRGSFFQSSIWVAGGPKECSQLTNTKGVPRNKFQRNGGRLSMKVSGY